MDMEEGLKALGALDSVQRERAGLAAPCWPPWKVLLAALHNPREFDAWKRTHGLRCERCSSALRRVEADLFAGGHPRVAEEQEVGVWAVAERPLAYAAAVPVAPLSPGDELPRVEFHKVEGEMAPGLEALWLVVWEEVLFVVVVGEGPAAERLRVGARLVGGSGELVGNLEVAEGAVAQVLLPAGAAPGRSVVVLQCDRSVGELMSRSFTVPELAKRGIRLVAKGEGSPRLKGLLDDLVARNRVGRFLSSLPREVESPAEALTLSFYLRLLLDQGRVPEEDKRRLADLPWVAEDIKARLR